MSLGDAEKVDTRRADDEYLDGWVISVSLCQLTQKRISCIQVLE